MISLTGLPKIVKRGKKRVGRGVGSGKGGHTAGRGQKGQKTRSKIPLLFEGTKIKKSLIQRLPMIRGKGRLKPQTTRREKIEAVRKKG
jgi:large subunit ribosomal protein L15